MAFSDHIASRRVIAAANPWHAAPSRFAGAVALVRHREAMVRVAGYFDNIRRPAMALFTGPRGVGKSVILHQLAARALVKGVPAASVLYLPMGMAALADAKIADLPALFWDAAGGGGAHKVLLVDDVHGIVGWEAALHRIFAQFAPVSIIATSALAPAAPHDPASPDPLAQFEVIAVPPLSFTEYLRLTGRESGAVDHFSSGVELHGLNDAFFDYLNRGGFPGLAVKGLSSFGDGAQFVLDIVDDGTPNFAGIHDTRDLRRTFTYLVGRSGEELAYEAIAKDLGIAKNTLRKYIDYLERAGLLYRLHRVDLYGKRMERATRFKAFPSSPSFYPALFGPVGRGDSAAARVVETALAAHFALGAFGDRFSYAAWSHGAAGSDDCAVSLIAMADDAMGVEDARLSIWSPAGPTAPARLDGLLEFCRANRLTAALVFDSASFVDEKYGNVTVTTRPASWGCYLTSHYFDPAGAHTPGPYALRCFYK